MWSLSLERRSREVHDGHAQAPSPPRIKDLQTLHILKGTVSNPQWLRRGFREDLEQSPLLSLPQRQNGSHKVSIDVTLFNFFPSLGESLCFYMCELMISVFLEKAPVASIGRCPCPSSFFTSSESLPLLTPSGCVVCSAPSTQNFICSWPSHCPGGASKRTPTQTLPFAKCQCP